MIGRQRNQQDLFNYSINLDQRVRQDHPLRKVRELVDFSFVREEVARFYGQNGHESLDPEVLLKMMFLLFFDNLPSERELLKAIAERLDYLWFLGYGIDDPIPNHSSFQGSGALGCRGVRRPVCADGAAVRRGEAGGG
ncbi:transposase [Verrucomicrobiota bacterium sgz303538]